MYEEPKLSEAEWALILELLERERSELPVEIHHTRSSSGTARAGGNGAELARPIADADDGHGVVG